MGVGKLFVGTSGYDYPEWKGVFYPEKLARKDFLSYYATRFNALELNNTFYSMPTAERMEGFVARSEGKVHFSVKANRLLTHEIGQDWKLAAETFKDSVKSMNEKGLLSAVLFQFPQSFHYIPDNRFYLSHLVEDFQGYPVVIEFRHREWLRDSVFEGLSQRNVSVAFCDMPNLKALPAVQFKDSFYSKIAGPQAYIRLHGRNADAWYVNDSSPNGSSRYDYDYSDEELLEFVPIIHMIQNASKNCQIFFNNHPKGSGALNGLKLMEMLNH